MQSRRHTFGGPRFTAAILVIAATVWGLAASAGSLRNGSTTTAQVTGGLPGQSLWTYYDTSEDTGVGDNILTLINPNGSANANLGGGAGNTCAMIYVFDDDEEMGECCGCPLTPAGIEAFSVENDLTSNWGIRGFEGQDNGNGSIAIVAAGTNVQKVSAGPLSNGLFCPASLSAACNSGCDPTNHPGYSVTTATNLLGSIEHNQGIRTGSGMVAIESGLTETALFDNGGGDPTNLAYLQAQCGALVGNGSGGGICKCPRPDPNAIPSPHITATATPTPTPTTTATPTATPTIVAGPAFSCPAQALNSAALALTLCEFLDSAACSYDTSGNLVNTSESHCPSSISGGFCPTHDNSGNAFAVIVCAYGIFDPSCQYDIHGNLSGGFDIPNCPTHAIRPAG